MIYCPNSPGGATKLDPNLLALLGDFARSSSAPFGLPPLRLPLIGLPPPDSDQAKCRKVVSSRLLHASATKKAQYTIYAAYIQPLPSRSVPGNALTSFQNVVVQCKQERPGRRPTAVSQSGIVLMVFTHGDALNHLLPSLGQVTSMSARDYTVRGSDADRNEKRERNGRERATLAAQLTDNKRRRTDSFAAQHKRKQKQRLHVDHSLDACAVPWPGHPAVALAARQPSSLTVDRKN